VSLQISSRVSDDVTILDLRGRLTIDRGSQLLSSHLQRLIASGVSKLLLNLADLTQIDSTGINSIVRIYLALRGRGGDLKLQRPSGRVLEAFKVMHVAEIIPSFEDETQALASFRPLGNFTKLDGP
jgi:anti-anti-sigma factor